MKGSNESSRLSSRTSAVEELLKITKSGLYCPQGDFYVDPWGKVERAIVTHAHSDHARPGMKRYLCSDESERVLRLRVGQNAPIDTLPFGQQIDINGVKVSLHPAGHIIGSAQVRVEYQGKVAVVSGDYKTQPDRTCTPFEPIRCNTFITESTFGLPIYQWPLESEIFSQINRWWRQNQEVGKTSILMGYSLGKTQRALSGLDPSIGPIIQHDAIVPYTDAYRMGGVDLPDTLRFSDIPTRFDWPQAMIIATPGSNAPPRAGKVQAVSSAFMSGWTAVRRTKKRGSADRGFILSDHVDWPSLLDTIAETRAEEILVTHGYTREVVRYLLEQGLDARELPTHWSDEEPNPVASESEPADSEEMGGPESV